MVFDRDFGLSSGSIEGVHSDIANPGRKKSANVPKPVTLVLAVLMETVSSPFLFLQKSQ